MTQYVHSFARVRDLTDISLTGGPHERQLQYARVKAGKAVGSEVMTYTVERVCSCVGKNGRALFRLTYESSYVPELNLWRHFLVAKKELISEATDPQRGATESAPSASKPRRLYG